MLVRERDGVAFRHGLIGEVIYERLLPAERAALHRAIAAALDDARPQRAHHCHRAGLRAEALAASVEAGSRPPRVYAYAEARVHFERALELGDASVDRVELLARAAQAARFSGDPERAVALCREAIALEHEPRRQRCSTSASASSTSGTTRPRSRATSARWSCSRASRGCWRPRATR